MTNQKTGITNKVKVNMKNCLITVARNLEGLLIQQARMVKRTVNIIMNSIAIYRQKQHQTDLTIGFLKNKIQGGRCGPVL